MAEGILQFLEDINNKRERAWGVLYRNYYVPLCHYALKIVNDGSVSEDVVQEVLVRMWEIPLSFDSLSALTTYLYRSVHNNSLKLLQEESCLAATPADWWSESKATPEPDMLSTIILEESVRTFRGIVELLPRMQREVILLSLEEKNVKEIAEALSISPNTVKKYKKEAYVFLRKYLSDRSFRVGY